MWPSFINYDYASDADDAAWLDPVPEEERHAVFDGDLSLASLCRKIRSGQLRNVVVMCGAGISVAAGIPDFRSPDTGLYAKLRREHGITRPESLFDIKYFRENPRPFMERAVEMLRGGSTHFPKRVRRRRRLGS